MTAAPLSAETKDAQTGSPVEVLRAFLKLGLTCFGGPIAHIGYFREEFVVRRKWLDEQAYADLVALCQRRPRPAKNQPPPCPRRLARRTEVVGRRAPTAPLMGQHNRTIAADLGFTAQDIAALQADGVLYAEEAVANLNEKAVA